MFKMKKYILLAIVLSGVLYPAIFCLALEQAGPRDVEIVFYGKVVDQYYKPVSGAEVHADIFRSKTYKSEKTPHNIVKADKKGLFIIRDEGVSLYVDGIQAEGYELLLRKNLDRSFEYSSTYRKASFRSDQAAPIIFHMQKIKDEPAYLIHQPSMERNFLPTEKRAYYLNLGGNWIDVNGQFQNDSGHIDLNVKCGLTKAKDKMELTFMSMDSNSGVIASDKLLEVAPLAGYEPDAVIEIDIPDRFEERTMFVYAKARGGLMYSRLELELTVRPSNLLVQMNIWTNPEHSRNLKYDKEFQKYVRRERYEIRDRRYQENIRAMKLKSQFKYVPRTMPSSVSQKGTTKDGQKKVAAPGYYLNAP